ncbi:MAG: hypothetical protein D6815_08660 [Candidatus Dadabacteria bacterium]|nr:MAG: hypothetical protein D6815_08660 [Candidatus Dadabacteria bacterium]
MNTSQIGFVASVATCALLCLVGAGPAAAQPFDHLTCYKVKDAQKFKGIVTLDALQNQFDLPGSCKIVGKAKLFCVPTVKTVDEFLVGKQPGQLQQVPGPDVVPDRICYKVKCPAPQATSELVSDQFGSRQLAGFKPFILCTPAIKGLPPTSTTSTTLPPCTNNIDCDDGDVCTIDTCVGGVCNHAPDPTCCTTNAECDDGDVCTTDTCVAGACNYAPVPGCCTTNAECDDGNVCTIDSCVAGTCNHSPMPDGSSCDDGDLCTNNDVCGSGTCVGTPIDCSYLDSACTVGVCNPSTGTCSSQAKPNGTVCDDGNVCTTFDACTNGVCVGIVDPNCCQTASECDDGDACTVDTCVNSSCSHSVAPDGTPCDDGNVCTTPDTCTNGVCGGTVDPNCCQSASECDDGNTCTIDTCVNSSCSHSVSPDGTPCTPVGGGQGTCQSGQCVPF